MSVLILHAIVRNEPGAAEALAATVTALDVRLVQCGKIAALVSVCETGASIFENADRVAELAKQHNELLVNLAVASDLVPVRLGTVYSSEPVLLEAIARDESVYLDLLRDVQGAVEINIQLVSASAPVASEGTQISRGRDYLKQRGNIRQMRRMNSASREAYSQTVVEKLADISVRPAAPLSNGKVALLIPRADLEMLDMRLSELGQEAEELGLAIQATGPWPAYSFSGGAA